MCQRVCLRWHRKQDPDRLPYESPDEKPSKPIGPASVAGPFFYGAMVKNSFHWVS